MIYYYLPISDRIAGRRAAWLIPTNAFSTFPAVLWKLILCPYHQGSCKMLLEH